MAPTDTLIEPYVPEQPGQIVERDICIRGAAQDQKQSSLVLGHALRLSYELVGAPHLANGGRGGPAEDVAVVGLAGLLFMLQRRERLPPPETTARDATAAERRSDAP